MIGSIQEGFASQHSLTQRPTVGIRIPRHGDENGPIVSLCPQHHSLMMTGNYNGGQGVHFTREGVDFAVRKEGQLLRSKES